MKSHNVILPVRKAQKIDANYGQVFDYLNSRHATVHLVVINDHTPVVYSDSAALRAQQAQVHKMTQFLKYEMLDRMAISLQASYPNLSFEYHVEIEPLNRVIATLRERFDAQMLIVDQRCLDTQGLNADDRALQYVISMLEMPIWIVGSEQKRGCDVAIAVDLPAHNHQIDQLNRTLLVAGAHFAANSSAKMTLLHSWQPSGEHFMRSWLQLTEFDVARYARLEKQQREAQLQEYIADGPNTAANAKAHIVDGLADEGIVEFCQQSKIGLLVVGHNQNPHGPIGHTTASVVTQAACDVIVVPQYVNTRYWLNAPEAYVTEPQARYMS